MKQLSLIPLTIMLGACSLITAQVQIDRPIELTGDPGQRTVTNLDLPVNGSDAANKDYVDSASGGFTHYIGELFGGGVVVAVWKEGGDEKGLVVSLTDISASEVWSNVTNVQIGSTAASIWDGASNTAAIIAQAGHTTSAAKLCADLTDGGFTDWYLPAVDELTQIFNARFIVNRVLGANGLAYDATARYWSSTEWHGTLCWDWNFQGGGGGYFGPQYSNTKNTNKRVRAVRKF